MSIHPSVAICAFALLVVLSGAVACSSDDNKTNSAGVATAVSTSNASKSDLCSKIDDLQSALKGVNNLNANSTVNDAKNAQAQVSSALDEVKGAAESSASSRITALQTAQQAISNAINSISASQTLGSAATLIKTQVSAISSALDGLRSDVKCS